LNNNSETLNELALMEVGIGMVRWIKFKYLAIFLLKTNAFF